MTIAEAYEPIDLRDINKYPKFYFGGFWRRTGAAAMDFLFVAPLFLFLLYPFTGVLSFSPLLDMTVSEELWWNALVAVYAIVFIALRGATPGKTVCKLKVVTLEGRPVSILQSLLRYSPYVVFAALMLYTRITFGESITAEGEKIPSSAEGLVHIVFLVWCIASAIVLARHPQRRAPHDLLAGTAVIKV